ncbi:MAG: hypothetical protein AAB495_04245 [Patescibacteria group bacterium]
MWLKRIARRIVERKKKRNAFFHYYNALFFRSNLNLSAIVKGFMEYATLQGKRSFPPLNHKLWHDFLWKVQERLCDDFLDLVFIGKFKKVGEGKYRNCHLSEVHFKMPVASHGCGDFERIRLPYEPDPARYKQLPFSYHNQGLDAEMYKIALELDGFMF